MELETQTGRKLIKFLRFSALDGWDIHDRFTAFASSNDPLARRAYVLRVLSYARVLIGSHELPLSTGALIDNHLCTPENVHAVFKGTLEFNGISIERSAGRSNYATAVGNEIATSFVASCMGAIQEFAAHMMEGASNVR